MSDPGLAGRTLIQKADALQKAHAWRRWALGATAAFAILAVGGGAACLVMVNRQHAHEQDLVFENMLSRGETLFEQGDYGSAAIQFRHALAMRPDSARAHLDLGRAQMNLFSYDAAVREFRTAIQKDRSLGKAYADWGRILDSDGRHAEAVAKFREGMRNAPTFEDNYVDLANSFELREQLKAEVEVVRQGCERIPTSALLQRKRDLIEPLAARAGAAWAKEHQQESAHPGSQETLYSLAEETYENGNDVTTALARFRETVARYPNAGAAHFRLGWLMNDLGCFDLALLHFQRAGKLHPTNARMQFDLANSYKANHQFKEALATYRLTINLHPYGCDLGGQYNDCRARIEAAQNDLQNLKDQISGAPADLSLLTRAASLEMSLGEYPAARQYLHTALTHNSRDFDALNELGMVVSRAGDNRQAASLFQKAVNAAPNPDSGSIAEYNLGFALDLAGDLTAARAAFAKAARGSEPQAKRLASQAFLEPPFPVPDPVS